MGGDDDFAGMLEALEESSEDRGDLNGREWDIIEPAGLDGGRGFLGKVLGKLAARCKKITTQWSWLLGLEGC